VRGGEGKVVRFGGAQGFPPFAVHPKGRAAIGERCFRPGVMFQSSGKEADLVSDRGGILYNIMASTIGLSRFPHSAIAQVE